MPFVFLINFNNNLCVQQGANAKSVNPRLVVEDFEKRRRIIATSHDLGHFGVHRTNDIISKKYYWPGLFNDVRNYVSFASFFWQSITLFYVGGVL